MLRNKNGLLVPRNRLRVLGLLTALSITFILTACGSQASALPSPEIKIYLLDLTASGSVENQLRLIKDDLMSDITSQSLGSPYLGEGPSLTKFYFTGTNSRALREISLQDFQVPYDLYQYIQDENNDTRTEKFWRLLSEKYQTYLIQKIEEKPSITKSKCQSDFDSILTPTWSSERVRDVYTSFMCRMVVYSLSNYSDLNSYIVEQSSPGVQKASDVFGALSKISSQVKKFQKDYPKSMISVKLATDGDHNLGANNSNTLRRQIQESSDVCSLAKTLKTQYGLENLVNGSRLSINPRGIAALVKGNSEYPAQLESFWNCFFLNE